MLPYYPMLSKTLRLGQLFNFGNRRGLRVQENLFLTYFDLTNKQVCQLQLILSLLVVDWGCPELLLRTIFVYRDKLEIWKFLDS